LKRWGEVDSPEIARILSEVDTAEQMSSGPHHDESRSTQRRFAAHVLDLVNTIEEQGNPFMDQTNELTTLDTKLVMPADSVNTLEQAEIKGKQQYKISLNRQLFLMKSHSMILSKRIASKFSQTKEFKKIQITNCKQ